jgi:hypothetical protein
MRFRFHPIAIACIIRIIIRLSVPRPSQISHFCSKMHEEEYHSLPFPLVFRL